MRRYWCEYSTTINLAAEPEPSGICPAGSAVSGLDDGVPWVLGRLGGMAITMRPVVAGDAARIAVLLDQLGYPTDAAQVRTRLDDWLADRRSVLIAAEADGLVSGVAALHVMPLLEHDGRRGRLVALVVDDACRGQGLGRMLVAEVEQEARRLGCRDLEVTSSRTRHAAQSFYRGLGYEDVCDTAARFMKALDERSE
jgi:GNAT superfamily N-acetyltransferase